MSLLKLGIFRFTPVLGMLFCFYANSVLSQDDFAQLAQGESEARVIVMLNVPGESGEASPSGGMINLNRYIKQVQKKLASEMGWRNFNDIVAFEEVPAVAKTVDAQQLRQLQRSSLVAAIYEDRFNDLTLNQSTRLIGLKEEVMRGHGGQGVSVAVLDTGVADQHGFLADKVVGGACFSGLRSCPGGASRATGISSGIPCRNLDGCDHGTHVAGIIAGDNGRLSGVAPEAKILAVNVFSARGEKLSALDSDIIQGLEWVYKNAEKYNIASVNMSLGGGFFKNNCDNYPTRLIIDKLLQKNILTIVASGNNGFTRGVAAPSCISSAVSVGATDKNGNVADFSNSYVFLDMVAPGKDILSSVLNNRYSAMSGTSMAAPHVAGAVAVLRSAFPQASATQLRQALKAGKRFRDPRNRADSVALHLPSSMTWLANRLGPKTEPAPRNPEPRAPEPPDTELQQPEPVPEDKLRSPPPSEKKKPVQPAPEKKKCTERVDGILIERTADNCDKKEKMKW